jgi:hypothetical protein
MPSRNRVRGGDRLSMERMVRLILEAAQAEGDGAFVRSAKVVRRALEADGKLTPKARRWLEGRGGVAEEAMRFYDVLVRLVCCPGFAPLLEGQGNFGCVCYGHPDHPPAHPRYTECRITDPGRQYLAGVGGADDTPAA